MDDPLRKMLYANVPLPHYVWVCELYLLDEYKKFASVGFGKKRGIYLCKDGDGAPRAFAELIIDATADRSTDALGSMVMRHYPSRIGYWMPDEQAKPHWFSLGGDQLEFDGFPAYTGNLSLVVPDGLEAS